LKACYRGHIFLFAEETHADVVPKLSRIWVMSCCYSVLQKSSIMITLVYIIEPAARIVLGFFGSIVRLFPEN